MSLTVGWQIPYPPSPYLTMVYNEQGILICPSEILEPRVAGNVF